MPKIGNANREDLIISTNHMDLKQKPKSAKIIAHFSGLYKAFKRKHKPLQKPYTTIIKPSTNSGNNGDNTTTFENYLKVNWKKS